MGTRFIITLEDGTRFESHDGNGNQVLDHANLLYPHNTKKWFTYELISPNGTPVSVDFRTGIFRIGGVEFHPATDAEFALTNDTQVQNFPVTPEWNILNGLPYFPVVGRRTFKGDIYGVPIDRTFAFCGWKKKFEGKTVQKLCFLSDDGRVIMT